MKGARRRLVDPLLVVLIAATVVSPAAAERLRRTGDLEVVSSTLEAEVFVDGERVGEVPLEEAVRLPVGEHSIKVSKRGFTQHLEVISIRRRETTTVEVDLLALSGVLRVISSVDDARVFVDGDFVGTVPLEHDVDPGARAVKVTARGYHDHEQAIEVVAGQEAEVAAELERLPPEEDPTIVEPPTPRRWYEQWWLWTAVGAVVVAVAIGVPLGVVSSRDQDDCERLAGWGCESAFTLDFTQN